MRNYEVILCISDMHHPYSHPDCVRFLKALSDKYLKGVSRNKKRVVCLGDELDYHASSYHESSTSLPSAALEHHKALEHIAPLYDLFPEMDLVESNHGSLAFRKANSAGLPRSVIKNYRDQIEAPQKWFWHFDLILGSGPSTIYFHHGKSAAIGKLSQAMSMCAVQGHFHEKFHVTYWGSPVGLFWDSHIGCLIDWKSLAFAYGKNNVKRPVIGTGVIVDGQMKLEPMVLNKHGRWTGKLK